jgi:uncharacterized protein YciI
VFYRLSTVNAPDYFDRRDLPCPSSLKMARYGATYRLAHINMCLDMRSTIRAAGPSPDGTGAQVFYSVPSMDALEEILRNDPYVIGGIWTSWSIEHLNDFIAPLSEVPVCLDGSRRVTVVEAPVSDRHSAISALQRLRDEGVLAAGGITDGGTAIVWMSTGDHEETLNQLRGSGIDVSRKPRVYPMIWAL